MSAWNFSRRLLLLSLTLLLMMSLFLVGCSTEVQPVDLVLIVDTSASMRGAGGAENIFARVQQTAQEIVRETAPGSSVTVISYDSDTNIFPTIMVQGEKDQGRLEHQISTLKADGQRTYTAKAIKDGLARAAQNEQTNPDRIQVVILLTDGLNDPPPSAGPSPLDVGKVIQPYSGKPWYVHYVQLGQEADEELEALIEENFPNATTKKDTGGKELSGLSKETSNQWKQTALKVGKWTILGIAALVALVVASILILRAKAFAKGKQLYGELEYWQKNQAGGKGKKDLTECGMSVSVGSKGIILAGCSDELIKLSTTKEDGQWVVVAHAKGDGTPVGGMIRFKGKALPHLTLYSNDVFEIGEWSFRYKGATGPRPR